MRDLPPPSWYAESSAVRKTIRACCFEPIAPFPRSTRFANKGGLPPRLRTRRPTSQHSDRASGEDLAAHVTDRAALMDALGRLPGRQRACVVLRYFEELDVRETAAALRCSEGNVKSQTSRGLAALRAMFDDGSRDELVVAGEGNLPW